MRRDCTRARPVSEWGALIRGMNVQATAYRIDGSIGSAPAPRNTFGTLAFAVTLPGARDLP